MPQSASPVGLARIAFPQNNSTSDCSVCNRVVLAGRFPGSRVLTLDATAADE
jgi:hypothetical protein